MVYDKFETEGLTHGCFALIFRKGDGLMQLKRAGFLTKIVVLALLIYLATSLLDLRGQIQQSESLRDSLARQVGAAEIENLQLSQAIAASDDPATMEQVARDKGYVKQGEVLYIDVAN